MSDVISLDKIREEKERMMKAQETTDAILEVQKQKNALVEHMKRVASDIANQEVMIFVAEESYESMIEAADRLNDESGRLDMYIDELKKAIESIRRNQMDKKRLFGKIKREYRALSTQENLGK